MSRNTWVVASVIAAAGCVVAVSQLGAQTGVGDMNVIARLERAALEDPMNASARLKLGTMLLDQGRLREGESWLREAAKADRSLDGVVEAILAKRVGASQAGGSRAAGADVFATDVVNILNHGVIGTIRAYSIGSSACNIGTANLEWINAGSPGYGMNAYRLKDGRLMQIGLSFAKTACCAFAEDACGLSCNGVGGNQLGVGCRDVYQAGWNAIQSALAARSAVNPYTGAFSSYSNAAGDAIFKRLQVLNTDVTAPASTGALFFVEGVYVSSGDSAAQNWFNNATYRRVTVDAAGAFNVTGSPVAGTPAIHAWRESGGGVGIPDNSVTIQNVDIPSEGRFVAGSKVIDIGHGFWRYEYAVFNLNSDKAGGSFSVPLPVGVTVKDVGFHAPFYHSGEIYSNAPWTSTVGSGSVTWTSPETFAQNANTNALRWGTMYNFWFTADQPPQTVNATLGLFKPHTTQSVTLLVPAPEAGCPADFNGDGLVNSADLALLLGDWGASNSPFDIDGGLVGSPDLALLLGAWGPCP